MAMGKRAKIVLKANDPAGSKTRVDPAVSFKIILANCELKIHRMLGFRRRSVCASLRIIFAKNDTRVMGNNTLRPLCTSMRDSNIAGDSLAVENLSQSGKVNANALQVAIRAAWSTPHAVTRHNKALKLMKAMEDALKIAQTGSEPAQTKRDVFWFEEGGKQKKPTSYKWEDVRGLTKGDMNKLLHASTKQLSSAYRCRALMNNLGFKGDAHNMTILISAHLQNADFAGASLLFNELVQKYGTAKLITVEGKTTRARKGASPPNNSESILSAVNSFVHAYALEGDIKNAKAWFERLSSLSIPPDVRTITGMISAHTHRMKNFRFNTRKLHQKSLVMAQEIRDSERWFSLAQVHGLVADKLLYLALIRAYATATQGEKAFECLERMRCDGLVPEIQHYSVALGAYLDHQTYGYQLRTQVERKDFFKQATLLFDSMEKNGCKPDKIAYNTMLSVCANASNGNGNGTSTEYGDIDRYFQEMLKNGHQPDAYTLGHLGNAYANRGDVDRATALFNDIDAKAYDNVRLQTIHLNHYLKAINRSANLPASKKQEMAVDLWARFIQPGALKPDSHTYMHLIKGANDSNAGTGSAACEFWFSHMLSLVPRIEPEPFVLAAFKQAMGTDKFNNYMMRTHDIASDIASEVDKDIGL
jgi:pentatricopeptide repeat protein